MRRYFPFWWAARVAAAADYQCGLTMLEILTDLYSSTSGAVAAPRRYGNKLSKNATNEAGTTADRAPLAPVAKPKPGVLTASHIQAAVSRSSLELGNSLVHGCLLRRLAPASCNTLADLRRGPRRAQSLQPRPEGLS